uniref:HMA domain-containing protein n=1 Tax=Oryza punctata TaxID=4537 RepID=A0A0E0K1M7_ORYPU
MRTEMVIRMQASSEKKGHAKAMKVAAAMDGVESVTLAGEGRNLLRVVGSGVDSNHLTSRLRRKVGHADIVELRTLYDTYPRGAAAAGGGSYTATSTSGRLGSNGYYYSSQLSGGRGGNGAAAYSSGGHQYGGSSYSPYYHQHPYDGGYYHPSPYGATAVQHEYYPTSNDDPNGCSIM